jgi:hypothetical protein
MEVPMKYTTVALFCLLVGCSRPVFTGLGNGVLVPRESIDKYAAENGLTIDQARTELRREIDANRVKDHSVKFGVTEAEAKRQLDYAASQEEAKRQLENAANQEKGN